MDNMKNGGHAGTAEAENTETMDLLTGMLDAATPCGDNDGDGKETAQPAEKLPAKNPRREMITAGKNRQFYSTSKGSGQSAPYRIQHTGQKQDEGGFKRIIQQT